MTHIINQDEALPSVLENTTNPSECDIPSAVPLSRAEQRILNCNICQSNDVERLFTNEEALFQHIRAKHSTPNEVVLGATSAHADSRPADDALAGGVDSSSGGSSASDHCACPACDLTFASEALLQCHLDDGISPPEVVKAQCEACMRLFQNERGLGQHMLSCSASKIE
jgi:hypothetical protein